MQSRVHVVEALAITRHRRRTVPREPRSRSQVDVGGAQLDALQTGLRPLRHEQVVFVDGGHRHDIRSAHVEAPAARHTAADVIARRESAAVEVEPQIAREVQPVRLRGVVAAALYDIDELSCRDAVARQRAPVTGHAAAIGIDRLRALERRDAQPRLGRKAPDLVARPRIYAVRPRECRRRRCGARDERELPLPRPHLHTQAPFGCQLSG